MREYDDVPLLTRSSVAALREECHPAASIQLSQQRYSPLLLLHSINRLYSQKTRDRTWLKHTLERERKKDRMMVPWLTMLCFDVMGVIGYLNIPYSMFDNRLGGLFQ